MNAEFLASSVWRGRPTEELENAWDRITLDGFSTARIEISDLYLLNKTIDDKIKFVFDDGTEGMPAILEVFHQLHCLVSSSQNM